MEHIFKQGEPSQPTFVLLHGTGGDEHDLLPVAEMLDPSYNVLGVRGNVSENGRTASSNVTVKANTM